MSDDTDAEDTTEHTGRTVKVDTGYYSVEVYGDPEDSLDDVVDTVGKVAKRAHDAVEELDEESSPNGHYE